MVHIDIHRINKVADEIHQLDNTKTWVRSLTITDGAGVRTRITLYSDNKAALLF